MFKVSKFEKYMYVALNERAKVRIFFGLCNRLSL